MGRAYWWHCGRIVVGGLAIGMLGRLVPGNDWVVTAVCVPLVWMLTMVSSWLLYRANIKGGNEPGSLPRWNWRILVSPSLYYGWRRRRDQMLARYEEAYMVWRKNSGAE